jgi:hypothetical protein
MACAYLNTIQLSNFTTGDEINWANSSNSYKLTYVLTLSSGTLNSIKFTILVFKRDVYTAAGNFSSYSFYTEFYNNVSSNSSILYNANNNLTSSLFLFGVVHSGKIRNDWSFALSINAIKT